MSELVRDLIVVANAATLAVSKVADGLYYAARALVLAVIRHRGRQ